MSKLKEEEKKELLHNERFENIDQVMNLSYADKFEIEDLLNRRLYLNSDIDSTVIDTIGYSILRYNRLDFGIPTDKRKPIILYLNSLGGFVTDGYALIDIITNSHTPVYTVNLGICFSMGLLVFLAGHKRYAMPHSEFLLHDGQTGDINSVAKVKDRLEFESNYLEPMNKRYILEHTTIDEELFDKNYRKEWYFLPDEGKAIGVVDYIIGKDCDMYEIL